MGYETRITIVSLYNFPLVPLMGSEIAHLELSKCGSGPLGTLISSRTKNAPRGTICETLLYHTSLGKEIPFALYAHNPQRQYEAVELLREVSELKVSELSMSPEEIRSLSNDIEDGMIYKDCYGSYLGVFEIDEFVEALKEELAIESYRRFQVALTLLLSIKENFKNEQLRVITYGH